MRSAWRWLRKQQKREKLEQEVSFIWRDVHHLEEELDRVEEELEYRAGKRKKKKERTAAGRRTWKRCHG